MANNLNKDILKLTFQYLPQKYYSPIYQLKHFQEDIENINFKTCFEIDNKFQTFNNDDTKFLLQSKLKVQKLSFLFHFTQLGWLRPFISDCNKVLEKYIKIKELKIKFSGFLGSNNNHLLLAVDTNKSLNSFQQNLLLCEDLNQLERLDIWKLSLDIIPNFVHLKYLNCSTCKGFALLPLTLVNLKYLNVSFTEVLGIPNTYVKLKYLNIRNTEILSLPNTLIKLKYLNISGCKDLMTLPETYDQLISLTAYNCHLICLPEHSTKLLLLETNNLDVLKSFTNKYTELKNLSIEGADFNNDDFPIIPTIEKLDISCSSITELPKFLTNLKILHCIDSQLENIPKECIKLEEIYFLGHTNTIRKIPKELVNLKYIGCHSYNLDIVKRAFENKEMIKQITFNIVY
jgi:hypothetical protein